MSNTTPSSRRIPFTDPRTQKKLTKVGDELRDPSGDVVAPVVDGIPRFVEVGEDYAENFGFQWNEWKNLLSDDRSTGNTKYDLLVERTHFDKFPTEGATILECGMGGGDDTEALLQFPFAEVHSFDLSRAVDLAAQFLDDSRLVMSQASIYDIPYPDESFDFVFCHRVLQHTPDPAASLRSICRKVKPGGVLFTHSYKKSWRYLMNYKYKLRWLTKRLPLSAVYWYVQRFGPIMRSLNRNLSRLGRVGAEFADWFVPFDYAASYGSLNERQLLELDKLCTFDALTPAHDHPMTSKTLCRIIESEGFRVDYLNSHPVNPVLATATKVASSNEVHGSLPKAA